LGTGRQKLTSLFSPEETRKISLEKKKRERYFVVSWEDKTTAGGEKGTKKWGLKEKPRQRPHEKHCAYPREEAKGRKRIAEDEKLVLMKKGGNLEEKTRKTYNTGGTKEGEHASLSRENDAQEKEKGREVICVEARQQRQKGRGGKEPIKKADMPLEKQGCRVEGT